MVRRGLEQSGKGLFPSRRGIVTLSIMSDKHIHVNQLTADQQVNQVFLVRDKDLRTTRSGGLYVQCTLADKTGTIPARMWQANESIYASIPDGGYLHVKGRSEDYKGTLQIIIDACRPVPADKVDVGEFLAVSAYDVEEMWAQLLEIIRDVKNKHLRMLIKKFVEDQEFVAAFKKSPAAMEIHNPFIGGLLEHTLNMARAARALLPLYPKLNVDLVLAGIFLHDMGKAAELTPGVAIGYTDRGQLVGHITIAAIWLDQKASAVAEETSELFPQKMTDLLQHIILSHHGLYEYGSPKLPAIPEAYFIHYLDNLDAKMFMTLRNIANDPDPSASFTSYNRQLGTRLYKRSETLE